VGNWLRGRENGAAQRFPASSGVDPLRSNVLLPKAKEQVLTERIFMV
jgi:hypothetical protein